MRHSPILVAVLLSVALLSPITADDSARHRDKLGTDAAIRKLVQRGAVVKRFAVRESETEGLLVRLKAEHLDQKGIIESDILLALQPMSELALELRGLPFSDDGLRSLLASVKPVGLDVSGSEVSDRGLQKFAIAQTQLRMLDLSFTRIGDEGLRTVASLRELRHLSLIGSRVTDSGTACLAHLRQLHELYLAKTAVSSPAAEQLRRRLPMCRIER